MTKLVELFVVRVGKKFSISQYGIPYDKDYQCKNINLQRLAAQFVILKENRTRKYRKNQFQLYKRFFRVN